MPHAHSHNPTHVVSSADKTIIVGLILNSTFMVIELIAGILTGSLALIADAAHNVTDTFTLGVSFIANRIARKDSNYDKTFGYGRATVLAALLNSLIMLGVATFIVIEAIDRLRNPVSIRGSVVVLVALVGIAVNGSIAYFLSKHKHDLNMKSAYVDMAFDAISSVAAVLSGLLIMLTGINGIDSAMGLVIAVFLVYNTFKIINEAVHILLEGTPKDKDITAISDELKKIEHVIDVDDVHIWTIRSGFHSLSCHIVIDEVNLQQSRDIVLDAKKILKEHCGIDHATIEIELAGEYCNVEHSIQE